MQSIPIIFQNVKNDLDLIISSNEELKTTNKNKGIYLIYLDCDEIISNVLPFWIEKSSQIGPHWSSQKSRIKKYLSSNIFYDESDFDCKSEHLVFHRLKKYVQDYQSRTGRQLSVDDVHAVCLSTTEDVYSLDDLEAYWSSRLMSEMTSLGHCLFVKTLRRIESKVLYSKDTKETKRMLEYYLYNAYKYGAAFLNDSMIYTDMMYYGYAKDNLEMMAYYIYQKGLPFIEDSEVVDLHKIKRAREFFYELVKRYFST